MAPSKAGDEKALVDRIRTLQRSNQDSRRCADCIERGPTYVCLDFQTFVCQTCSGLHREFGHKIKSISLSEWSPTEVAALESGGNEVARSTWMARWSKEAFPEPDSADLDVVRDFIRMKYEEKKWFRPQGRPAAFNSKEPSSTAVAEPAYVVPAAPKVVRPAAGPFDLLSGGASPPTTKTTVKTAEVSLLGGLDFSTVNSNSVWTADFSSAPPPPTKAVETTLGGLIDLDFSGISAKAAPSKPQEEPLDMFASLKMPLSEPAEEPAPAHTEEESGVSLGEKLRQALMSGSHDDLKRLFKECADAPVKRTVSLDPKRGLEAFSAFDELAADAFGAVAAGAEASKEAAPERTTDLPEQTGIEGPTCFFIGDDNEDETPNSLGEALDLMNSFGSASTAAVSSTGPATTPAALAVPQQTANGLSIPNLISNLTSQQLETMNPQELLQIQMMISRALQARAPQPQPMQALQQVQAPAPMPSPAPWQSVASQRQHSGLTDADWSIPDKQESQPFGDLLDMFKKTSAAKPSTSTGGYQGSLI